jgi:hypothetical protein
MQHNLREFLRHGGSGQYVFARQNGAVYGYRAGISIKSEFPGYADLRADFTDQLDRVIADNSRMLLNALTPPDTVPSVTEADLRDVSDAKEEALRQWDTRLRERNEALDTRVYARAAAWILGADRWDEATWRRLEAQVGVETRIPVDVPAATISPEPALPRAGTLTTPRRKRRAWTPKFMRD